MFYTKIWNGFYIFALFRNKYFNIKNKIMDVLFDINKAKFNFNICKKLIKSKYETIKGLPYYCKDKNNLELVVKIFPVEVDPKNDNSLVEIIYMKLLYDELYFISPNILKCYTDIRQIPNKSKCLKHISFKKLNDVADIYDYSNILMFEYCPIKDIDNWEYSNNTTLIDWKHVIFQIIYTLCILQDKYSFMHNDMHPANILIKKNDSKDLKLKYKSDSYILNDCKYIAKICDFEFSNIYNDNYYKNPVLFNEYDKSYDLHTFLKGILEISSITDDLYYYIESLYPLELLYINSDIDCGINNHNDTLYLHKGFLTNEAIIKYKDKLPTPLKLLNDPFFREFKTDKIFNGENCYEYN